MTHAFVAGYPIAYVQTFTEDGRSSTISPPLETDADMDAFIRRQAAKGETRAVVFRVSEVRVAV